MPESELGRHAVVSAVIEVALNPGRSKGKVLVVSGKGLEAMP